MHPTVFRGVGITRGTVRLVSVATAYVGGFAVLWGLGLVVRDWQGWLLVGAPLIAVLAARLWAWRRVAVQVHDAALRYEGAVPTRDFEVELDAIRGVYFDRALPDRPLVLVLADGDERVCGELSPQAARALRAHLVELGVPAIAAARAG